MESSGPRSGPSHITYWQAFYVPDLCFDADEKSAGRPNFGETETIKQRAITVYLPTGEMVEKWREEAKRYGVPLS